MAVSCGHSALSHCVPANFKTQYCANTNRPSTDPANQCLLRVLLYSDNTAQFTIPRSANTAPIQLAIMGVPAPSSASTSLLVSKTEALNLDDSSPLLLTETDENIRILNKLVISHDALRKAGYIMTPLTQKDLELKKRCGRCHKCKIRHS